MPLYTNIGGTRKEITSIYPNVGGARKSMSAMYANIDGAQKQIFTNQKTVKLSTLSAGDSFYLTDSEGFSEYKLIKKAIDYTSGDDKPINVILAMRVNALNVNIANTVKKIWSKYNGDYYITEAINNVSAVRTYGTSVSSYFYSLYQVEGNAVSATYHSGPPWTSSFRVFLGHECLINRNSSSGYSVRELYFYRPWYNEFPTDIVNTKSLSNVNCYYNSNERGSVSGDYDYTFYKYYVYNGSMKTISCDGTSTNGIDYTYTPHSYPSSLYFRPHVIFAANKEATILIP